MAKVKRMKVLALGKRRSLIEKARVKKVRFTCYEFESVPVVGNTG